jgi:coenzyme F420-0:L-glutamate ligase/coenzyme F420-1:gamma-L-glutamate ligase
VAAVRAHALAGLPELSAGDDLARLIADATEAPLRDGQVVTIAHKAVSKCEGAVVALAEVQPSERARELAAQGAAAGQPRDARAIQVVLDQSVQVLRAERGVESMPPTPPRTTR